MKTALTVTSLLAALLLPVAAKDYKLPKEKPLFSITFPDKWEVTHEDESVDGVSEDGAIELYVQTDDAETIEDSAKESIEYLTEQGVKIKADTEKKHEGEINGMKVQGINWDGTDTDGECRVSLSFIVIGENQVITLLYWGSEEAEKEHSKEIEKILGSMKVLSKDKDKGKKEEKPAKEEKKKEKEKPKKGEE